MQRLRLALLLLLLAGGSACKDGKPKEGPAGGSDPASPSAAASEPDLPDPLALDCARIVPDSLRTAQFPGFGVKPTIEGPIATCAFSPPDGTVRPSVSLFCHRRKRDWNFAHEMARDPGKKAVEGLGRAAYSKNDHVFFYPSKLDCLARVIWPGDPAKGAVVARNLDSHLSKATVTPSPAP